MSFGISLHVWGDYACFTRPELKAERVSYEVMTPSAARGILTAIYWKPQFNWVIDRIHVLKPIRTMQIRRNEVKEKMTTPNSEVLKGNKTPLPFYIEEKRQQRSATILKDVSYVIDAHIEVVEEEKDVCSIAKHLEMFKRRARAGQCFHSPYFGNREFPVMFELVENKGCMPISELPVEQLNRSFGLMLHDMVYKDDNEGVIICAHTGKKQSVEARFFMANLKNGVLHIPCINKSLS